MVEIIKNNVQTSTMQIQKDVKSKAKNETNIEAKHTLAIRTSPLRVSGTTLFPWRDILPARNSSRVSCQ